MGDEDEESDGDGDMSEGDDPDASQAMVNGGGSEPNGRARSLSRAESLDVRFPRIVPIQILGSSPRRMYRICTRDLGSIRYKAVSVVTASVINTRVTCTCFATLPGFFACRVECSVTSHACIPEAAVVAETVLHEQAAPFVPRIHVFLLAGTHSAAPPQHVYAATSQLSFTGSYYSHKCT